jgi:branched-chain amino acid transport system permease protein
MGRTLAWLAGTAVLMALSFTLTGYHADLFRKLLLTATLAVGYNFQFGIAGQIAFSHYAFYGIGAYAIAILTTRYELALPLAALATIGIGAAIALAVAIPANRLEGFYIALATLAFAQLFVVVCMQGGEFTGGPDGLAGFATPEVLGVRLAGAAYMAVVSLLFLANLALFVALDRSWFGRACRAMRDDPEAAAAMGIDVARTRIAVFTLTSTLAAVAGMAYAFADNYVSPDVFRLDVMFVLLFMVLIGGAGSHAGAVLGATFLFLLPEQLGELVGRHYLLAYGVVMVLVMMFLPRGLISLWHHARRARSA